MSCLGDVMGGFVGLAALKVWMICGARVITMYSYQILLD
jgi:hypothetical protein